MKLYIKQRVFSIKDRFTVFNALGEEKYFAEGKILSLGKKLTVTDQNGTQKIYIEQRLLTFMPKYEITVNGRQTFVMKKELTLFKPVYSVPELSVEIKGDFLAHEYTAYQNNAPIASLSKRWLSWGDTYEIDIANEEYELLALACILTIDCVMANQAAASN